MNIMRLKWFGGHTNRSATVSQTPLINGNRSDVAILRQKTPQKPHVGHSIDRYRPEDVVLPPGAAKLDSSAQQQRLWLARGEVLGHALKWFGTRFIR